MTTGLHFDPAGRRSVHAVSVDGWQHSRTAVLEYVSRRRTTLVRYVGAVPDAHQLLVQGGTVLVAATFENTIVRVHPGLRRRVYTLPGEPDSWHVSGIADVDGEIFATAFHRGGTFRQWSRDLIGQGLLFSLKTGAVVVDALSAPHSPLFAEGLWLLCDSANKALVAFDPARPEKPVHRLDLSGWTRGLALGKDAVYVGLSARRHDRGNGSATATIAVVDRETWTVVERIPVPAAEIFDICVSRRSEAEMLGAPVPKPTLVPARLLGARGREPGETTLSSASAELPRASLPVPAEASAPEQGFPPRRDQRSASKAGSARRDLRRGGHAREPFGRNPYLDHEPATEPLVPLAQRRRFPAGLDLDRGADPHDASTGPGWRHHNSASRRPPRQR